MKTLLWLSLGLLSLAYAPQQAEPKADAPAKPVVPLKTAPIEYFNSKCARCHGPMGMFYAHDFTKKMSDDDLKKVIKDMASGQGASPVDDDTALALVSMHHAIDASYPFLSWTGREGLTLTGESGNADKVTATVNGSDVPVKMDDTKWSVTLDKESDLATLTVTAVSGDHQSVLMPAKSAASKMIEKKS